MADPRRAALIDWINGIELIAGREPVLASCDASFRRYFRLQTGSTSFIAMDAPPDKENCLPFVRIAGYLEAMQLNAPRIIEADLDRGFLLLSDLGNEQYLEKLEKFPDQAASLYSDAIDSMLVIQRLGTAYQSMLPPYNEDVLRFEMSLFRDWLCGTYLQLEFSKADEVNWQACCDILVENALRQPQVFVHRDYHSRNLMVTKDGNPGILDFQDALEGPFTYDLVSLLKDCYIRWPAADVWQWALRYYRELDAATREQVDELQFRRYFELMGIQRHLKAAGIFCRLKQRDGKSNYMADVPRTLNYIVELGPDYEELGFLMRLIEERVLPVWSGDA
ncbi:MAG: phosphotransferase [Proteobacteria bacterium]|nr:phosphotransferase [Pseudomonadota bacterium]